MKTLDLDACCHLPPISNIYHVPEWWQMTIMPLCRYTPIGGKTGNLMISPSDGQPSTAPRFPSTQAMRSHRVSSALDLLDVHGCHRSDRCSHRSDRSTGQTGLFYRSDRSGAIVDPPSLRTWLSAQPRNLQWFCGEPLVKPRRRRLDLHAKLQATSLSLPPHGPPTRSCLVP